MSKNKPRYKTRSIKKGHLKRVKTGPSVKDKIVNTISKIKDNKSSENTPTQGSPDSKILNESTGASRYKDMIAQDINSAYLAGGSRPMTQSNTIQPGATNAPNMGNFGGAMNMSNVPNNPIDPMTGLPMNQAMMAQEVKGFKANVRKIMNQQGKSKEEATKILAAATWKHNPEKMAQNRTGEYYDKTSTDYTNAPSENIPLYERNRKINRINLMAGRGPNLDSIQKVNSDSTSGALKEYYKGTKWKKDIAKSTKEFNKLSKEEQYKL